MTDTGATSADRHEGVAFLFETSPAAAVLVDPDGTVSDVNERAASQLGYERGELLSMAVGDVLVDGDGTLLREHWRSLEPGDGTTIEGVRRSRDGDRRRVEIAIRPVELDGRDRVLLLIRDRPKTGAVDRSRSAPDGTAAVGGGDVHEYRRAASELGRGFFRTIVDVVEDGVYALDEDLRFTFVNDALCELTGLSRSDILGTPATELFAYDDELAVAEETRQQVVAGDTSTATLQATIDTPDGPRQLESRYRLYPEPDGEFRGSVGVIRDVTERERRERALRRRRDELATLDRVTELLLETLRALVTTSSRAAVERTVCERLADSEFYGLAWIGRRDLDGDRIVPEVVEGGSAGYPAGATVSVDGESPAARAFRTGTVHAAHADEESFPAPRDAGADPTLETVAAVPLRHRDTVYGVLEIGSPREQAFTEREQAGLDVIGRTVGFVIYATRSRELLFADAVVELTFDVTDADSVMETLAAAADCELELEGYVPAGEEWLLYLAVDGTAPGDVVAAAAADPRVDRSRVVVDRAEDGRVELAVADGSLLHAVTTLGATVSAAAATPTSANVVVEVPVDVDVRDLVAGIRDAYPEADLVSHHERDREVATVGRPDGVLDGLTDRQREALAVAYRSGYFEWPRESTAEEVAATMGIEGATLHSHLRKAQARLLSALLDAE